MPLVLAQVLWQQHLRHPQQCPGERQGHPQAQMGDWGGKGLGMLLERLKSSGVWAQMTAPGEPRVRPCWGLGAVPGSLLPESATPAPCLCLGQPRALLGGLIPAASPGPLFLISFNERTGPRCKPSSVLSLFLRFDGNSRRVTSDTSGSPGAPAHSHFPSLLRAGFCCSLQFPGARWLRQRCPARGAPPELLSRRNSREFGKAGRESLQSSGPGNQRR